MKVKFNNPHILHHLHALNVRLAQAQMSYEQLRAKFAQAKFDLENAQNAIENFVKENKIK